jgi:hypothetical protein
MAATPDRRHVITADSGAESLLVVWDAGSAEPVQTVSNPHPWGIKAMDVSPDGLLLATIGTPDPENGDAQDVGAPGASAPARLPRPPARLPAFRFAPARAS